MAIGGVELSSSSGSNANANANGSGGGSGNGSGIGIGISHHNGDGDGTGTGATARLLDLAHFNLPWILMLIFLTAFVWHSITTALPSEESAEPSSKGPGGKPLPRSARKVREALRRKKQSEDFSHGRKLAFLWLSVGVLATYLGNILNVVAHALEERGHAWWCGEATAIYFCASTCFWIVVILALIDTVPSPCIAQQVTWVTALCGEIVILGATVSLRNTSNVEVDSKFGEDAAAVFQGAVHWDLIELILNAIRVLLIGLLVALYMIFRLERSLHASSVTPPHTSRDDERAGLLSSNGSSEAHANGAAVHGLLNGSTKHKHAFSTDPSGSFHGLTYGAMKCEQRPEEDAPPAWAKPTTSSDKTWWEYLKGYSLFFPYLWPNRSRRLQIVVVVCFVLVIAQRAINVVVPIQLGRVTDRLYGKDGGAVGIPWVAIAVFVAYKFLHGDAGLFGALRAILWLPVSQYSYKALAQASFEHVHELSMDFHIKKRQGEVTSALNKGSSLNQFLEQITFQVIPMIFDLGAAIFYFAYAFDAYYALVVTIITFFYVYLTIRMARWRSDSRRLMQKLKREEDAVKSDSLTAWESVKYFGAEAYEFGKYRQAVSNMQTAELKVNISLNVLAVCQNLIFIAGLLIVAVLAAYQVTTGKREVGEFVTVMTYMTQLQGPLNFFGNSYRGMQSAMINGERLLELFKEKPTVVDECSAKPMHFCQGRISFENVRFSYDKRKPALHDLSFDCVPGTTTAFVGESGGGKSTIYKLLYRYYNIEDGSIQIDGRDIRDVTIASVRANIGVVPQETVLFNDTLMYNLRYANQDVTDDQIVAACKAASIHDRIMSFPDGYLTRVGERGTSLSGGEKQRVAIARAILKDPRIIMLDEATAALDTDTEQNIQDSMAKLSQGRTVLMIAHRLSTITHADQILVLHAGKIVECGDHATLIAKKGKYATMWRKQIKAARTAEAAAYAAKVAKAWKERPGSSSLDASENEADGRKGKGLALTPADRCGNISKGLSTSAPLAYHSSDEEKSDESRSLDSDSDDAKSLRVPHLHHPHPSQDAEFRPSSHT